jgi:DNA-binding MarR family transcriptional regulator
VLRINNRRAELLVQERLGLSLREALIIQAASSEPPLSQGYMADILGINRNVMVLEIDRLDDQQGSGHLKRERRPESRREATIVLTPKGRRTLAAINKLRAQGWQDILRPSTPKQISDMLAWARAVIAKPAASAMKAWRHSPNGASIDSFGTKNRGAFTTL